MVYGGNGIIRNELDIPTYCNCYNDTVILTLSVLCAWFSYNVYDTWHGHLIILIVVLS